MRKVLITTTAAALLAGCSGHGTSSLPPVPGSAAQMSAATRTSQSIPAGWAATATQAISISGASDSGPLASSKTLTVRLGLGLHNVSQLQSLIASGTTISTAQFMGQYAPTQTDVSAVTTYLKTQGLTNVSVTSNNQLVSADGTVAQLQAAFNTKLDDFGGGRFANVTPALVPQSLGGIVVAVLGLNNAARMALSPKISQCYFTGSSTPAGAPCLRNYGPAEIQQYYDAGSTPTGSNTTVAVISEGNVSQAVSDLAYAETTLGTPKVPVNVVTVGLPSSDVAGLDEWELDSQSSTGIAGTVKTLYFYATTSLTDSDIANDYEHWAGDNLAKLGNSSFGECEYQAYLDGAMKVDDNAFMQAAAQGQTMFASTGDTGSACALVGTNGVPGSGLPMAAYPASSPWVVAVGGTSLTANPDGSYLGEAAWNAGGGGLSQFENSQPWMQSVQPVSPPPAELALRGIPDVAMDADPNTSPFMVYSNPALAACGSSPCGIGGTSLSSPLAMGTFARLQTAHNNTLGFGGRAFYRIYALNPNATASSNGPPPTQTIGGYHDILTGANGAYTALPGFDYTTGMGTFDIALTSGLIGR
ncbi:MAG: S8/S53 family peptidase [Candidatus Eremiobacteraeota bacterium]|nr:S8/S53 family peptidase [Candidatus Eremiobacteraeota bacterium]